MKIDAKKIINETNDALSDLRHLDASNWSKSEKEEVLTSVEEVMKLGLLAKWKIQKAYFNSFVENLDAKAENLDISILEKTTLSLESIITNIKQLNSDIDTVSA